MIAMLFIIRPSKEKRFPFLSSSLVRLLGSGHRFSQHQPHPRAQRQPRRIGRGDEPIQLLAPEPDLEVAIAVFMFRSRPRHAQCVPHLRTHLPALTGRAPEKLRTHLWRYAAGPGARFLRTHLKLSHASGIARYGTTTTPATLSMGGSGVPCAQAGEGCCNADWCVYGAIEE